MRSENFAAVLQQLECYACVSTTSASVNLLEEEAKLAEAAAAEQSRRQWPWSPRGKKAPTSTAHHDVGRSFCFEFLPDAQTFFVMLFWPLSGARRQRNWRKSGQG